MNKSEIEVGQILHCNYIQFRDRFVMVKGFHGNNRAHVVVKPLLGPDRRVYTTPFTSRKPILVTPGSLSRAEDKINAAIQQIERQAQALRELQQLCEGTHPSSGANVLKVSPASMPSTS